MYAQSDSIIIKWRGTVARHAPPVAEYFVYLLHLRQRFHHAAHYTGATHCLPARLALHKSGHGAKLLRAVVAAGIDFEVAALWKFPSWEEARAWERAIKARHNAIPICPLCNGKPVDFLVQLRQGHWPISRFARPGRRQPMKTCSPPVFVRK